MYYYTVYNKNDEVIASGNSVICARNLGLTLKSFYCMISRVERGKNKKYMVIKEKQDER